MYTYNSFYAGTNNKIEALLREVKRELSEIREELKCMKENKTIEKGRTFLLLDKGIVHFHTYFQLSWQGE